MTSPMLLVTNLCANTIGARVPIAVEYALWRLSRTLGLDLGQFRASLSEFNRKASSIAAQKGIQ